MRKPRKAAASESDPARAIVDYEAELARSRTEAARFRADSALLRELGERLVGRPHIALAELVKNAYDADATRCIITIDADRITVADNGHGMTKPEFLEYWMTIGTRNKERVGYSRKFKRSVTGSKGVGRLAAQFLAHRLQIVTTPDVSNAKRLHAFVDWDDAVQSGSLTEAIAKHRTEPNRIGLYPAKSPCGTFVLMESLKQAWTEKEIEELGRQIWMLNSPVPNFGRTKSRTRSSDDFRVELKTTLPGFDERFEKQMRQALENNQATIRGRLQRRGRGAVSLVTVSFADEDGVHTQEFAQSTYLAEAEWEIRVYDLTGRQEGGVSVQDMREYFEHYGGVMVYDAGFRLPYYGAANDWLGLEFDHSHRRSRSALLPDNLQVSRGLNDLPTQGRIFGIVNVNTGQEQRTARQRQLEAGEYLKIQVSRDRLVGNKAFEVLKRSVRQSIDYYAMLKRRRSIVDVDFERPREAAVTKVGRLTNLVREARERYPEDDTIREIESEIEDLEESLANEGRSEQAARSLLGPLASTGMVALAMEHEVRRDITGIRRVIRGIRRAVKLSKDDALGTLATGLEEWIERLDGTRRILQPMMDTEDRRVVRRLVAGAIARETAANIEPYVGRSQINVVSDDSVLLPAATIAEWHAVLQNLLLNAANATLDSADPRIEVRVHRKGRWSYLDVSDNGVGVDLNEKDELFKPFERRSKISDERRELGVGGTGLGLTIVEMIATQRECWVDFVEPEPGWATTFRMSWSSGGPA
jgi:signal transduction histidine kinase